MRVTDFISKLEDFKNEIGDVEIIRCNDDNSFDYNISVTPYYSVTKSEKYCSIKYYQKKTVVVSAFPCCGKTYAFENYQDKYSMLDSDSSQFSWIKDENGNNTKERNPDFPNNYIQHIKNNIGKVDIIFVSSHKEVREALDRERIKYITVYPYENMLNEWVGRMYRRGNDKPFIQFIIDNWDEFMREIKDEPNHGVKTLRLRSNDYINVDIIYIMK